MGFFVVVIFVVVFNVNLCVFHGGLGRCKSFFVCFNISAVMETSLSAACVNVFSALDCSSALVSSVVFLSSIILSLSERGGVLVLSSSMFSWLLEFVILMVDVFWSKAKGFPVYFPT